MTPMTDDRAIRAAFADLTEGQPPMPPGRFGAVRRRVIRRRRRQASAVVVSAVALAAVIVGLVRLPGVLQAQPQTRPSWALPWHDYRNGSVPQSVLDGAVLAWHDQVTSAQDSGAEPSPAQLARLVASYDVSWYVGQTVAHGHAVAVIFEASSPATGHVLVTGWASASEVMRGQPAWSAGSSPWELTSTAAPGGNLRYFGPDVSEYVPALSASGLTVDNWVVALTGFDASGFSWTAAEPGGQGSGRADSAGLAVIDVGQVSGDVMLTFGAWASIFPVGLGAAGGPAGVPALAPPRVPTPPTAFHQTDGWLGYGNQVDQDSSFAAAGRPYVVLASCYNATAISNEHGPNAPGGSGPLTVTINRRGVFVINCSNRQQQVTVPRWALSGRGLMVQMTSSALTSWRVALGYLR